MTRSGIRNDIKDCLSAVLFSADDHADDRHNKECQSKPDMQMCDQGMFGSHIFQIIDKQRNGGQQGGQEGNHSQYVQNFHKLHFFVSFYHTTGVCFKGLGILMTMILRFSSPVFFQ
jgi:hypothetical protein